MGRFESTFQCKPQYRLGEKIRLTFQLKNVTNETYTVLTRDTPLDKYNAICLTVSINGKPLAYDGVLVKRCPPTVGEYHVVKPNDVLTLELELTNFYKIDQTGSCTVAETFDVAYFVQPPEQAVKMHADTVEAGCTASATFQIVAGNTEAQAVPTSGELARRQEEAERNARAPAETAPGNGSLLPIILNANDTEREKIKTSHFMVYEYLKRVEQDLTLGVGNRHYAMVFGKFDSTHFARVQNVFTSVKSTLEREQMTYEIARSHPDFDTIYAYTHFNSRKIFLCFYGLNANIGGMDSQMGAMLHEMTHAICSVNKLHRNEQYGRDVCRELAKKNPAFAADNADSYEFFIETQTLFWEQYQKVPYPFGQASSTANPSLCEFDNTLYGFYKSPDSDALYSFTYDGSTWLMNLLIQDVATDAMPAAAVYQGTLYVTYKKAAAQELQYIHSLGSDFEAAQTIPGVKTDLSPCPVVYNGRLYVFYVDTNGLISYVTFDGTDWSAPQRVGTATSNVAVSAAVFRGELYVIFVDATTRHLSVAQYRTQPTVRWTTAEIVTGTTPISADSPFAAVMDDILYVTFRADKKRWTREVQLVQPAALSSAIWMGNETVFQNSEHIPTASTASVPMSTSPVALAQYGDYKYAVFQPSNKPCFWVMQQR